MRTSWLPLLFCSALSNHAQEILEDNAGQNVTVRDLAEYPVCLIDSDCQGIAELRGQDYRCFQYMCYPWEQGEEEGDFRKCQVKDDCKGMGEGEMEDGDCFRHPDRKKVLSGICLRQSESKPCSEHSDCEAGLACVNGYCGDSRYLVALGDQQCVDDSLCRDLLLGDLCCYDVRSSPPTLQGSAPTLSRKCCQNEHDAPVIPPQGTVEQQHLDMIDQILSGLEEFEITKIYCLVFSDNMRDRMPSCNHSGGAQLTSSLAIIAVTAALL